MIFTILARLLINFSHISSVFLCFPPDRTMVFASHRGCFSIHALCRNSTQKYNNPPAQHAGGWHTFECDLQQLALSIYPISTGTALKSWDSTSVTECGRESEFECEFDGREHGKPEITHIKLYPKQGFQRRTCLHGNIMQVCVILRRKTATEAKSFTSQRSIA